MCIVERKVCIIDGSGYIFFYSKWLRFFAIKKFL